jgi:phosphatidylinositol alpha-1,6-mannosyltransferase
VGRSQNARDGDPGSALSVVSVRSSEAFRQRHHLDDGPLLLSVGRLSARKGLREFVSYALPRIVAARPDAMLAIAGDTPNDALRAQGQTPESIRTAAAQAGVADHVTFLGRLAETELLAAYGAADVHVFPIREIRGDPEGFGMVAVEAAAHGLPTVAFATGGVIDAVSEGRSGHLVNPGDYSAMADAVPRTIEQREALRQSCIEFARQFAWPRFGAQLAAQLGVL